MTERQMTFRQFLLQDHKNHGLEKDLIFLLEDVATACRIISNHVRGGEGVTVEVQLRYQGAIVHVLRGLDKVELMTRFADNYNASRYIPGSMYGSRCRADMSKREAESMDLKFWKKKGKKS